MLKALNPKISSIMCDTLGPARWPKIEEKSQPQFQGDSADRGAIANHNVASSSYSAAFEHVAGFI